MHMTVRITVSLPDEIHADLLRVASSSHVSASAVVRALLADVLPKMTGVLDFLTTTPPDRAMVDDLDAWGRALRDLMKAAPDVVGDFRHVLDDFPPTRDGDA